MTYVPRKGENPFVIAPRGWDRGYRAAQAALAASGTPIRVWMHGQSIMVGFSATNTSTEGFRWLVRNYLVNKFGRSADYFSVCLSAHMSDFSGVGTSGTPWAGVAPPWLFVTSPLSAAPYGFGMGNGRVGYFGGGATLAALSYIGMGGDVTWVNPGAQLLATFQHASATWLETAQAYDVVVPNLTAGTPMSYNVNSAGANNITLTADGRIQVIQAATGLSAGRYNTIITGVGATGQPWLSGMTAHATSRNAAGVQIAHIGANSSVLGHMNSDYIDKTVMGRDASSGTVGAGPFPLCPDLVINNSMLGDSALLSPELSKRRLANYIAGLRRAKPNCSIIFIADVRQDGFTSDGVATDTYALSNAQHVDALIALALQFNCAVVNFNGWVQGRGVTNGYFTSGNPHPLSPGHQALADLITPLL